MKPLQIAYQDPIMPCLVVLERDVRLLVWRAYLCLARPSILPPCTADLRTISYDRERGAIVLHFDGVADAPADTNRVDLYYYKIRDFIVDYLCSSSEPSLSAASAATSTL